MVKRLASCMAVIVCVVMFAAPASAQDEPDNIDDEVARWILIRGQELFHQGDYANAKKMFIESLERSPKGPSAKQALTMLRTTNEQLGVSDLDDGRPVPGGDGGPRDPYQDPDGPRDPYAGGGGDVRDPYGGGDGGGGPPDDPHKGARRTLLAWSGAYGLSLGLALAGPESDNGEIGGGAFLVGALGAGAGIGLSHLLFKRKPMTAGQVAATTSIGTWAGLNVALMVDVFDTDGTGVNDIYKGVAFGGLAGIAGGAYYAYKIEPEVGDISFANSLGLYGAAAGLLLGVGISPAEGEAYSLQAVLGSTAGFATGLWLSDRVDTTRRRMLMIDLGAAAGAAVPWILLYPIVNDSGTNNDEQALGWISTATMGGGAIVAWLLTRDSDGGSETDSIEAEPAGPTALLRRNRRGRWRLGAPIPRPMENLALAPPTGGLSLGVDILGGSL